MIFYRLISWLPFPLLYLLAWLAYPVVYYIIGYRKAVVMQNISRAFPEKSAREVTVLAKKFYRHLVCLSLEVGKSQRMSLEDFRERVTLANPELLREKTANLTRPAIVLTIHQGNWEWMLHGANAHLGVPIDPVYKPLRSAAADRVMLQIRSQFGARPVNMEQSSRDIIRRRREFRIFVMVADQSPTRQERGLWTRFLNQEAKFYIGGQTLAHLTGFPLLFAQCKTTARGHYQIVFHEVGEPPYDKSSNALTERFVQLTEQAIREQPETWLWSNRRWKRSRERDEALDRRDAAQRDAAQRGAAQRGAAQRDAAQRGAAQRGASR
jgi:KDO2-lipid IV(A) lauroyltransferase